MSAIRDQASSDVRRAGEHVGKARTGRAGGYYAILVVLGYALFVLAGPARAQIVNTLEGYDPDAQGFSSALTGSIEATGGNTETFDAQVDVKGQWADERHRVRILFGYEYESASGDREAEDTFAHLRHNWRIEGGLHSLAFAQWQRNPFQRLRSRTLLGAGLRFDVVEHDALRLALGAAHMIEAERLQGQDDPGATHRLSSFLDAVWSIGESHELGLNAFFQPGWSDFGDLRANGTLTLESKLGGGLSLVTSANLQYDSEPPGDVETTDWEIRTGLRYRF